MHTTKPHGVGPRNLSACARKTNPGLKSPWAGTYLALLWKPVFLRTLSWWSGLAPAASNFTATLIRPDLDASIRAVQPFCWRKTIGYDLNSLLYAVLFLLLHQWNPHFTVLNRQIGIGACRPGHTRALPGSFRIVLIHIMRTRCKDPLYSIYIFCFMIKTFIHNNPICLSFVNTFNKEKSQDQQMWCMHSSLSLVPLWTLKLGLYKYPLA